MIEINNIYKSYDGVNNVVDNLSLIIPDSTVFGFLGPNGAGKTTAIKILVGINKPDSGTILIDGRSPHIPSEREKIGFMPEEPHFYDQLTGLEFIKFANTLFSKEKQAGIEELENILRQTSIYEVRNKKIKTYSKGMRQRLGLAQALVNSPRYIFLDEPLEGLDPIGRRDIKVMLGNLKDEGKTIFFNSHILADVEHICDRIGIIHRGRLIYSGSVNEFRKDQSLEDQFIETINNLSF